MAFNVPWAGPGAVLLQAGGAGLDQADILAELLRLRTETASLNSSGGWDARHAELEWAVQGLRDFASEMRQREERADLRLSQLYARTNQLSHSVKSILDSRIWRTLVKAGGWALRLGELGGGGAAAGNPKPARTIGGNLIKMHCDEPDGNAIERILRHGISGTLRVRGWAISENGISRVELQAGDQPTVETRIGLHRPDLESMYPTFRTQPRVDLPVRSIPFRSRTAVTP
jgi:hypothetical protein